MRKNKGKKPATGKKQEPNPNVKGSGELDSAVVSEANDGGKSPVKDETQAETTVEANEAVPSKETVSETETVLTKPKIDVSKTDDVNEPAIPASPADAYVDSIISQMKEYEKVARTSGGVEVKALVIAQKNLWSVVETALNQPNLHMARVGIFAILNRMAEKDNYNIKYLFRCLADPTDPNPVIRKHTIKTYNVFMEYIESGSQGLSNRIDLDGVVETMNDTERTNVMSIFAIDA